HILNGQTEFFNNIHTMASRRKFLKAASLTIAASGIYPLSNAAILRSGEKAGSNLLKMGIAGYTFQNFTIEQSISMMQRIGIDSLSLKEFHLPLDSSQEKANEVVGKFRSGGITIYA